MAGPRTGYRATSRATPQERVLGFVLLCLFLGLAVLLVGACNHELAPETGGGAGGSGAGSGTGGQGVTIACLGQDSCVRSCSAAASTPRAQPYCDATGAFQCPDGSVRLSTCAANACVQVSPTCCDESTGWSTPQSCGPDGLKQACPSGSHVLDYQVGCIPTGLDTTDCRDLDGKPCDVQNQGCQTAAVVCTCQLPSGGTALTWQCSMVLIP